MKKITLCILGVLIAMPLHGQGISITMKEIGPIGQTTPMLQTDRSHARLDIPSLASQVLFDSATKTLQLLVPLLRTYREYTPVTIRESAVASAGRGQPAPAPITYKRTGTSKVREWTCTTYEGYRSSEKVAEVCAADSAAIGLTSADFVIVQQAIDMVKAIAPPEMIERIPTYGNVANQGYAGFPIRRVTFRNGQPETTTEVVEIRRDAASTANFSIPAGFSKAPQ